MAGKTRYRKPNMTNLPRELGTAIFKQIMNSPVPDREKMQRESQSLLEKNIEIRKREIARQNSAE